MKSFSRMDGSKFFRVNKSRNPAIVMISGIFFYGSDRSTVDKPNNQKALMRTRKKIQAQCRLIHESPRRKCEMLKNLALVFILSGLFSGIAQAAPDHWRTPEKDAAFAEEFSEESIRKTQEFSQSLEQRLEQRLGQHRSQREVQESKEDKQRALEATALIGLMVAKQPDATYNLATKVCDQRAADVPKSLIISDAIRGFSQASRDNSSNLSNLHPMTARYGANQFVNVAIRSYCPSLMSR
ncbi:DUF732 domain-containing protein [Cyanobacteria bacterium FACHB-DQ100]|nr:DUF732 domain-containing protein [Cyanobacteria bacterium FACHB-DQ100]